MQELVPNRIEPGRSSAQRLASLLTGPPPMGIFVPAPTPRDAAYWWPAYDEPIFSELINDLIAGMVPGVVIPQ